MTETLRKIVNRFQGKKVLVFGDLMLDEHIWSKVSRISPEAPVPIAEVENITHVPGGCGNVALNVKTLGAIPYLVSIIGRDSSGEKLKRVIQQLGLDLSHVIIDNTRPTILKSRVIAQHQHVVRVDREDKTEISDKQSAALLKSIKNLIPKCDAVIISDYGKGIVSTALCQAVIKLAKQHKKPVTVDPKGFDYRKYKGVTCITPNLLEAETAAKKKAASDRDLETIGKTLLKEVQSEYVIVTRGKDGISIFPKKGAITTLPAVPIEVFDITGAGDTVIAALTLGLAVKANIIEAATIANFAASVAVSKVGTAPVFSAELELRLEERYHPAAKIKSREELKNLIPKLKTQGKKIVFTNGCFDILHLGHIRYLKEAKKLGNILVIGLNSDSSVRKIKGAPRPYVGEEERAEILAALECVDYVTVFEEPTPKELISIVKPDIHVKGGDYRVEQLVEAETVQAHGGRVVVVSQTKGKSTTSLIEKILRRKG
ncbi:MAG: D-glycero-beta-D-manno-heptose-7-phosphate kinase [Candidatus Saganbacteria bacterium]|nr:D-glycero-beta-D-manno-heptose-7-phosphate kinase [Candidatus Saganbacteria bacterium]